MDAVKEITKISTQKGYRDRFAIYIDGEPVLSLHGSTIAQFRIKKGDLLQQKQMDEILVYEEKKQIEDCAFRLLAGRAHSQHELRRKMLERGFDKQLVTDVVDALRAAGHVDDLEFARAYARHRLLGRPMGERLLKQELYTKGIDRKTADVVVTDIYAEQPARQMAEQLIRKKIAKLEQSDIYKRKKRFYDLLIRRGFDWGLAKEIIDEVFADYSHDDEL